MKRFIVISILIFWLLKLSSQNPLWAQYGNNNSVSNHVTEMFVDPIDNKLYVGGIFTYLGGVKCRGSAKWNGTNWDSLGAGFDSHSPTNFTDNVKKILRYNNKIYYFGTFERAGNYFTKGMATWNPFTNNWDSTGAYPNGYVNDADIYNDTLYICGSFTKIGTVNTYYAAKFDGTTWYPMSFPYPAGGAIYHIRAYKNKVYGAGAFYTNGFSLTAEFTQQDGWKPSLGVQGDMNKGLFGLERIDTLLYFYGRFTHLSYMYSPCVAAYSGTKLYGFGAGTGLNSYSTIQNIKKIDNTVYALGTFDNAGGMTIPVNNLGVAELHNNQWCIYGQSFDNVVADMVKYNGDRLIAGSFNAVDGDSVRKVAKWIGGNYTYSCSPYSMSVSGIQDQNSEFYNVKIYPNPINDILNLEFSIYEHILKLEVSNSLGQIVYSLDNPNSKQELNLSFLASGIYYLKVQNISEQKVFKVVKE